MHSALKNDRPYVLTIAGFDPSGGAGLLADIKTFEQHKVYGLSVCTAMTLQTENTFYSIEWMDLKEVLQSVKVLMDAYPVSVVKIGIVPSFEYLLTLVQFLKDKNEGLRIILDPIFKSSTGFDFQHLAQEPLSLENQWKDVLGKIDLITPNVQEMLLMNQLVSISTNHWPNIGTNDSRNIFHEVDRKMDLEVEVKNDAEQLSQYCPILLKGGHNSTSLGVDYLFTKNGCETFMPLQNNLPAKHGSGCVLSAAIAANLALGLDLKTACLYAKKYIEKFLSSNASLLGYHH